MNISQGIRLAVHAPERETMTRQTTDKPLVLFVSHGFKNKDLADLIYGQQGIGFFKRRTIKGALVDGHDAEELRLLYNGSSVAVPHEADRMLNVLIAGIDDLDVDAVRYIVGKADEVNGAHYLLRSVADAMLRRRGRKYERLPVEIVCINSYGAVYWTYRAI